MKHVDYIVVGLGIAGLTICEQLDNAGASFVVFDANKNKATTVSGGVFNPVVLKRFTAAWRATELLETSLPFYRSLEAKLKCSLIENIAVHRIFTSIEEQNDWMLASDKVVLSRLLSSEILANSNPLVHAPFGFGEVTQSGIVNTETLLETYRAYLKQKGVLYTETFEYSKLSETKKILQYKALSASKIIFAEGAAAIHNPFFDAGLLVPNKGEYLIIKAPQLRVSEILKGALFIIPLGNDCYKVGATYSRDDFSHHPTASAKDEILLKLNKMITCNYEVIDQIVGVRPTVKDRKPLLGALPISAKKIFFNGLGTRGITGAPWLATLLFQHIENNTSLPLEVAIRRFS